MDFKTAYRILIDTIENNKKHLYYDRVTKLADTYKKLFTGEDIDSLLEQFTLRESEEMFAQRKILYQSVMPAVADNLSNVFIKPLRSNRVYSAIDSKDEKSKEEVLKKMQTFWHGESQSGVDEYLRERWFDLVKLDPNAFICVEFSDFDPYKEKASPYPIEYSSKEAINYEYSNGVLQYLIAEIKIKYKKKDGQPKADGTQQYKLVEGSKYTMYLHNEIIVLTEVDKDDKITDLERPEFIEIGKNKRTFTYQLFEPKSNMVPAIRVGYKTDSITKGNTYVSIFHSAIAYFKKELKSGSELDISMALHAFPQKIQYAPRCNGDKEKSIPPCNNGRTTNGETCPACGGSGMQVVHKTGQDIILVPFPKPGEQFFDIEKLLAYKAPPIDLIKFQDEYVDKLTEKARKAIFGGTSQIQKKVVKTATEIDYGMDDTYDTLHPFAAKYSAMWLFSLGLIATYTDNKDKVDLYHKFPNDFKLKTLQQLYAERKEAKESGISQAILDAIDADIQELLYADDQDTLLKLKIKASFMPFSGKSNDEVLSIITSGRTTQYYEVLYNHFEIIFNEIDSTLGDDFYILKKDKQEIVVHKLVEKIINDINAAKSAKLPIPIESDLKIA